MKRSGLKYGNASMMVILATAGLLFGKSLLAQRNGTPDRDARKAAIKELREQFRQWAQTDVFPTLSGWKDELDRAMSPDDLATLNRLRIEAKDVRKRIRQSMIGIRKAWRDEDYDALKQYRDQLSDAQKRRIEIIDELTPLAFTYRESLKKIGEEAKPRLKEWREKGKQIFEKWKNGNGADLADGIGRLLKWKAFLGLQSDSNGGEPARIARFMLWNGGMEFDNAAGSDQPGLN